MRWHGAAEEHSEEVIFDGTLGEVGDVERCVVGCDVSSEYSRRRSEEEQSRVIQDKG